MAGPIAFAALCTYVLTSTKPPFFDERAHAAQVQALHAGGSFRGWLLANDTSAAGPVYALMHDGLSGGQGLLPVPWFRLPNLVLLAAVLTLTALHLQRMRAACPWALAMIGMAMPMTWVMAGMALTEMPAMAGIALAAYAAARLGGDDAPTAARRWGATLLIALGVAIALCGRQTYLVVLPGILLIASKDRRGFLHATAGVTLGLVPAAWLFCTWGGLLPPKMAFAGDGLRPLHGFVAVCYAGLAALMIAPAFFKAHWRATLPVAAVGATLNLFTQTVHFTTMTSVQRLVGHPALARALEWCAGWIFVAAGTAFVLTTGWELWARRDRWFAGHAFAVLALCLACVSITYQFSSRYVGMSLPFMVPMLAGWIKFGPWTTVRLLVPTILGAASLVSYYVLA